MATPTSFQLANGSIPLFISPNFIVPEDKRPLLSQISSLQTIPIIDLNDLSDIVVQKFSKACQEYGFFQIINHGVSEELCRKMMIAVTDFFTLPPEERSKLYSEDVTVPVKVTNFYLKEEGQEKVTMWSENFSHPLHSYNDFVHLLPEKPPNYREVMGEYGKEMGELMKRLLGLISQGLGLERDCVERRIGEKPRFRVQSNYYPPCPEPELTLGLAVHTDLGALTVLQQVEGVTGLQVIKDGKWVSIDPIPNAFVVNIGDQIQVLSNGRYKSVHHRAVTNQKLTRVSIAVFYGPSEDIVIGPIEDLIDEQHPPLYRNYMFKDFLKEFKRQEGTRRRVKEAFELHP